MPDNLQSIQETLLTELKPYMLDKEGERILNTHILRVWREGFRAGRWEGKLDQHMLGGEA